jgi:hypothetical protein
LAGLGPFACPYEEDLLIFISVKNMLIFNNFGWHEGVCNKKLPY